MCQDSHTTVQNSPETALFPREELARYLGMMGGEAQAKTFLSQLTLNAGTGAGDDEIWVDVCAGKGSIRGSNSRSLLIAVYRFLREGGCRFLKPGLDGEIVPVVDLESISVRLHERASYSTRGICIEGANSLENVADLIDFLPKQGMNAYFIQFKTPHTFFDKWYNHSENDYTKGFPVTPSEVHSFTDILTAEITKRGLIHHAVGHGWTTGILGETGFGWEERKGGAEMSPEFQPYAALINGKRDFHLGVPLDTNLCYSNPVVLERIAEEVCDYLLVHPSVDVLHLWLADNFNNFCECEDCIKKRPSDHYVHLLNVVEERLSSQGSKAKICFLAYFDLLWPPQEERLTHPDRFVFLFAPITRTYQYAFRPKTTAKPLPFEQNNLTLPETPEEHMALLELWRKFFRGDSIMFDYHYMWYGFFDLGDFQIAQVLAEDIENLENLGFNGMISCQTNRTGMPSGLGLRVLSEKLWDKNARFEDIAYRYFREAYGDDTDEVFTFLGELSTLCFPPMLRENVIPNNHTIHGFSKIYSLVESFEPLVLRKMRSETGVSFRMWNLLNFVSNLARTIAPMYAYHASGNRNAALTQWEKVKAFVQLTENNVQQDFDLCLFIVSMERALGLREQYE